MSGSVDAAGIALPMTGGPMTMLLSIIGLVVTVVGFLARKIARA
jgi:hypothetical protein